MMLQILSASRGPRGKEGTRGQPPWAFRGCPLVPSLPLGPLLFLAVLGPTFFINLSASTDGERFCWHIFSNGRTRSNISISAHPDGSDQLRIGSDESAVFNRCLVFVHTVIIAGDHSCDDVHTFTDRRITQISEVHRFGSSPQDRFLDLDEVTDLCRIADCSSHAQMSIRADGYVFTDYAIDNNASFQYNTSVPDLRI